MDFDELITEFHEKSGVLSLLKALDSALRKFEKPRDRPPELSCAHDAAHNRVEEIAEAIASEFPEVRYRDKLKTLLWTIMLIPSAGRGDLVFYKLKLAPLEPAYKRIFSRLMFELEADGKCMEADKAGFIEFLLRVFKAADKANTEAQECRSGVYQFYREVMMSGHFHKMALAIPAYLNRRIAGYIRDSSPKGIKDNSGKGRYPPFWEVLSEPCKLMKEILDIMEYSSAGDDDWTHPDLKRRLEEFYLTREIQGITVHRRLCEYSEFLENTEDQSTLWSPTEELDEEWRSETAEETGTDKELLNIFSDPPETFTGGDYRTKLVSEGVASNQRCAGVVRLRHSWESRHRMSLDRLCAFAGFLSGNAGENKHPDFLYAFVESLLTGATVKKICAGRPAPAADSPEKPHPIGLYVTTGEFFKSGALPVDKTVSGLKAMLKEFCAQFPGFSFRWQQIAYTGRARILDKDGMSALDAAHCCGTALPGMRSSLHYVRRDGVAEMLRESNKKFLTELLDFSQLVSGRNDKVSRLMASSDVVWKSALDGLEVKRTIRKEIWSRGQYRINAIPSKTAVQVFAALATDFMNASDKEKLILSESMVLFFILSLAALRPQEARSLTAESFSSKLGCLFVCGKKNRFYEESRAVPFSGVLAQALADYCKYADGIKEKPFAGFPAAMQRLEDAVIEKAHELYSFRRAAGTGLYDSMGGNDFGIWQAIMGHSQVGFEHWGPFSRRTFAEMRAALDNYAASGPYACLAEIFRGVLRQ